MSDNQTQTNLASHDALTKFSKSLIDEASNQKLEIINELKQSQARLIKEKTKELENAEHTAVAAEKAKLAKETGASLAQQRAQQRREFILTRAKYADNIFKKVTKMVHEFSNSSKYENWLKKQLNDAFKMLDEDCEIKVRAIERDRTKIEKLLPRRGVIFEPLAEEYIGGFILICESKRLLIDCTLLSKINDERENFSLNSGLIIK